MPGAASALRALFKLPTRRKKAIVEATIWLALARFAVVALPFRWVCRVFGREGDQTPLRDNPIHEWRISVVRWTVYAVASKVPWTSKCLDQAIAAKFMLSRRGIPTTLYFGVKTEENGGLSAHAWLRSGTIDVVGGETRAAYTVVHSFADRGRPPRAATRRAS
jgi:hypothetical protein